MTIINATLRNMWGQLLGPVIRPPVVVDNGDILADSFCRVRAHDNSNYSESNVGPDVAANACARAASSNAPTDAGGDACRDRHELL